MEAEDGNFIDTNINSWADEECLMNFVKFLDRVRLAAELVSDEEGVFVGKQIKIICGDKGIDSDILALEWTLIMAPAPDIQRMN